jgi:anti-sigma regulatory factor (Ser/Thr protein kinase)
VQTKSWRESYIILDGHGRFRFMSGNRISFKLRNSLSELDRLCQGLEEFSESLGLAHKTTFEICIAMEELVSNIISYGYLDDSVHWIKISISHENGTLTIRIEDDGRPFNPLKAEEPDCECPLEERKVGNLGIHLTKKYVDDMIYERRGDNNILILKKRLEKT